MPGSADGGENAGWPKVANRLTTRYKESMSMLTPGLASGAQRLRRLESVVSALLEHGTMSRTELAETTGYSQSSIDRKSTRLNSSHVAISYAVFCLKKKKIKQTNGT